MLYDARRFPGAFAGRQNGRRFRLRPVETHDEVDEVVRRRSPVGFFVRVRAVLLDVERERAVLVLLHVRQHRGVDEVSIERVCDQELALFSVSWLRCLLHQLDLARPPLLCKERF